MPDTDEPRPKSIIKNCRFESVDGEGIEISPNEPELYIMRIENCRIEPLPEGDSNA